MGLLERIKENREEFKLGKATRKEQNEIARAKAQAAYDIEFQRGAVTAVKKRARRDAMERFGYSKGERRAKAVQNFTKELGSLGDWGAGNTPSPTRSRTRSRSQSHRKKSRAAQRQRKEEDPFDMSELDNLLF